MLLGATQMEMTSATIEHKSDDHDSLVEEAQDGWKAGNFVTQASCVAEMPTLQKSIEPYFTFRFTLLLLL